jgi:hypothetical protein
MEIFLNEQDILNFYEYKGLFFNGNCPDCRKQMRFKKFDMRFHCYVCNNRLAMTFGTIFSGMKITCMAFDLLLTYYSRGLTIDQISDAMGPLIPLSKPTITRYVKLFRLMIHVDTKEKYCGLVLPGPLEVDETMLYKFRKSGLGRIRRIRMWIVGIKCRTSKETIIYPILHRTKEVLLNLIRKHAAPNCTIYTDRYSAYFNNRFLPAKSHLEELGYSHFGVKHCEEFVSSIDNRIHINTVERTWRALKSKLNSHRPRKNFEQYISEFQF